jgi:hypothetical protein
MWGLLLLLFAAVYISAVGVLIYNIKPIIGKMVVLVAAILIPNADDWYYSHALEGLCKTDAGIKVYQTASRKDGLVKQAAIGFSKETMVDFLEWRKEIAERKYYYWRANRLPDGSISNPLRIEQYSSPYELRRIENDEGPFKEVRQKVFLRSNEKIVSEFVGYYYYGGWYPRALIGTGSLVAGCGQNGRVLNQRQWETPASFGYDGNVTSEHQLVARTFVKD